MDKRLYMWNKHFGFTATKWHGDVSLSVKNRYLKKPTDILLTTPESLEVILINKSEGQKKKIFGKDTIEQKLKKRKLKYLLK